MSSAKIGKVWVTYRGDGSLEMLVNEGQQNRAYEHWSETELLQFLAFLDELRVLEAYQKLRGETK